MTSLELRLRLISRLRSPSLEGEGAQTRGSPHFRITTENLLVNYYEEISRSLSWTLLSTMGVKFTPIVDDAVSVFTMGMKFTPIVDKITASKLHFFVLAMCYHTVF